MNKPGEKYRPSNGTEGDCFTHDHCGQCIHEKFWHTQKHGDKQCEIFSRTLLYNHWEPQYPSEWTYNEIGEPVCTEFKKWDWGNDGDPDDPQNPKAPTPIDPNQLCLPFEIINVEENILQKEKFLEPA